MEMEVEVSPTWVGPNGPWQSLNRDLQDTGLFGNQGPFDLSTSGMEVTVKQSLYSPKSG